MKAILSLHCRSSGEVSCSLQRDEFVFFIPSVVCQEEVQCSCSRSTETAGEFIKLTKGLLMLLSKEYGHVLGFYGNGHLVILFLLFSFWGRRNFLPANILRSSFCSLMRQEREETRWFLGPFNHQAPCPNMPIVADGLPIDLTVLMCPIWLL